MPEDHSNPEQASPKVDPKLYAKFLRICREGTAGQFIELKKSGFDQFAANGNYGLDVAVENYNVGVITQLLKIPEVRDTLLTAEYSSFDLALEEQYFLCAYKIVEGLRNAEVPLPQKMADWLQTIDPDKIVNEKRQPRQRHLSWSDPRRIGSRRRGSEGSEPGQEGTIRIGSGSDVNSQASEAPIAMAPIQDQENHKSSTRANCCCPFW